jgi:hypothetical protein
MGMMTSPARSARIGATDVNPGDLMSQASGYRAPTSGYDTSASKFSFAEHKADMGRQNEGHGRRQEGGASPQMRGQRRATTQMVVRPPRGIFPQMIRHKVEISPSTVRRGEEGVIVMVVMSH